MHFFETIFLEAADLFVSSLDEKSKVKILYNVRRAAQANDTRFFKKLQDEIWEFRIRFSGRQIRLLAFWDKRVPDNPRVIVTHGFIKKSQKTPAAELERASKLRIRYFLEKQ